MGTETLDTATPESAPARQAATSPAPEPCVPKTGAIVLARHGEPALSRRVRLDSKGYRDWWATYETTGLLEGQVPPEHLKRFARGADAIFSSIRPRSIETARAVCGDKPFVEDPLFVEAPLPPPNLPGWLKLSPRYWGGVARFWWWAFDHHQGQETHKEAERRAKQAAASLDAMAREGRDVLVLAHGFFNHMVGAELRRMGWRLKRNEGYRYWSARRFEKA
jgi:broad specificity phosphatase PhoE